MPEYTHIMLATLGGQPQVVTFTLDLLLQRNILISEVIVIHPNASHPRLKHSLDCLNAEFVGDRYRTNNRKIHLRSHVLRLGNEPLEDIVDDVSANAALNTIHGLIRDLKQQSRPIIIHLSISGGRRLMSLLAISAALLKFEHTDHIWHIYTPEVIRTEANEGAIMHVPPNAGVQLIEGPFAYWGPYFPNLPQYPNDVRTIVRTQVAQMDDQERKRCDQVVQHSNITPRELETLRAFANGHNPQQVAELLGVTTKTIDTYKTRLLEHCRTAWPHLAGERFDYRFLHQRFALYFNSSEYTP